MFEVHKLVQNHQNRDKLFTWTELLSFTGLNPNQIKEQIDQNQTVTDPLYPLTQSGKNYNLKSKKNIETNYSNPEFFKVSYNQYGVSTASNLALTAPTRYYWQDKDDWFWQQRKASKLANWLYAIPGVKKIYLVGSTGLEINGPSSDIDLAFLSSKGCVLLTRFWAKCIFKLFGIDTFSFTYNIKLILWTELNKIHKNSFCLNQIKSIKDKIWDYKHRQGLKVDLGMSYENEQQILDYYEKDERQLPILNKLLLIKSGFDKDIFDDSNFGRIYTDEPKVWFKILRMFLFAFMLTLTPIAYPLAVFQIIWHKIKHNHNPNHLVKANFCTFFPCIPESKYLTRYIQK